MLFILSFTKEFNNNQKRQTNIRPNESNIQLSVLSDPRLELSYRNGGKI